MYKRGEIISGISSQRIRRMNRIAQMDVNRQCDMYEQLCGDITTYFLSKNDLQKEINRLKRQKEWRNFYEIKIFGLNI